MSDTVVLERQLKEVRMVFESVRGYIEVASGLTELTRARAMEAAHGLLSLPATGIATSSKVAVQAGALADELMAAAAANRSNLRALIRSEVDVAVTRLGLVPVQKLQEAQSEAARLRAEVSRLRSATVTPAVPKNRAKKAAVPKGPARKAAARTSPAKRVTVPRSPAKPAPGGTTAPMKAAVRTSPAKAVRVTKSAAKVAAGGTSTPTKSAVKTGAPKRVAARKSPAKKAAAGTSAARKSAVTTGGKPAAT